jgi:hypothetical protein
MSSVPPGASIPDEVNAGLRRDRPVSTNTHTNNNQQLPITSLISRPTRCGELG